MKRIAYMFPGQGSQAVGMGKELHDTYTKIQELYERANTLLHKDLRSIMFQGPKDTLTETENAQPALLLSSVSIHTLLADAGIHPDLVVGHSLGEYSALVAAGSMTLDEALPLVATRGRLMEEAFPKGQGTMAAILGLSEKEIENVLKQVTDEVVDLANINCPGQIVVSGSVQGVDKAASLLKEHGARRVIPLNVSGPFHSRLMKSANVEFAKSLNKVEFSDASIPVYANVTAQPVTKKGEIKQLLIKQLYSPVRFEESIRNMMDQDIDAFVEVGNGKVLSGLVRKINRRVKTFAVQDLSSLEAFITWYKED
ncbi:MAG TPA: ACP S-malonyltransferase [Bacillota bacterium]|nr:ACP S-malonyltransferase [Bacillota bacterium]